jgi:cobalt-zinc-cadmium efflux system outer membrane protein
LVRTALAVSSLIVWSSPLVAQEWTERDVVELVLLESPLAREIRARADAAQAGARARALAANPAVSYRRESVGRTEFLEAQQTLPVTGRLASLRQAAEAAGRAAGADADARLWALRCDVRHAFYRVVAAQEREAVFASALEQVARVVDVLRRREQEGEGARYDRLRGERERGEVAADLAEASVARRRTLGELATYLPAARPIGPAVVGRLTRGSLRASAADLTRRALVARADYRAERDRLERARFELTAAERLRWPEPAVTVGAQRVTGLFGDTWGAALGVAMDVPLFNTGRADADRSRAEVAASEARLASIELAVAAEVGAAHAAALELARAASEYEREARAAAELLAAAETAYEEGEIGILELLDALRVGWQSRLRAVDLAAAAKAAEITLDRLVGEEVFR